VLENVSAMTLQNIDVPNSAYTESQPKKVHSTATGATPDFQAK